MVPGSLAMMDVVVTENIAPLFYYFSRTQNAV